VTVRVTPPSLPGWAGGSRWYRCDLLVLDEASGVDGSADRTVSYAGSLAGLLTRSSPLRLTCFEEEGEARLRQASCTGPHRYEYVGTWTAGEGSYRKTAADEEGNHERCRERIAGYARVPVDDELRYRTGSAFRLPSAQAWARGDRGVRCFYWSGGRALTTSVRDGGATLLPVN
jgi:hypothetical protein